MDTRVVLTIEPTPQNPRNSEGSFIRDKNGGILYAYSRWSGDSSDDHASCDIAVISSEDEGETWSDCSIIARASDFGVKNIMCASAIRLGDDSLCVFFIINEDGGTTSIGRTISKDGIYFKSERCICNMPKAYYVIENDRYIRLTDGRIATAAAVYEHETEVMNGGRVVGIVSEDDGKSFHLAGDFLDLPFDGKKGIALEEPEIIELRQNCIWILSRTVYSYQYQAFSYDGMKTFTKAEPSVFSSPLSPVSLIRLSDNSIAAAYNPIPNYTGRSVFSGDNRSDEFWSGRTPLVLRISKDNAKTWGELMPIETEKNADFSYPALFETRDGILCAYWCVHKGDKCSMRITKCENTD